MPDMRPRFVAPMLCYAVRCDGVGFLVLELVWRCGGVSEWVACRVSLCLVGGAVVGMFCLKMVGMG